MTEADVAHAEEPHLLNSEIAALEPHALLVDAGRLKVYAATAASIPTVLADIGRLREIAFRSVGQGTRRNRDIDSFDAHYHHLFVWDTARQALVGGYRIGLADEIRDVRGVEALYTRTLFAYDEALLDALGPAIELGRSWVNVDYQRRFAPLHLLWRGIGEFLVRHPAYRTLFGAVSIGVEYSDASRALMAQYLLGPCLDAHLAGLVTPRQPFEPTPGRCEPSIATLDALQSAVSAIEANERGLPSLLRQYVRLGGRAVALNAADAAFSGVADCLMAADLRQVSQRALERYLTPAGVIRRRDAS